MREVEGKSEGGDKSWSLGCRTLVSSSVWKVESSFKAA